MKTTLFASCRLAYMTAFFALLLSLFGMLTACSGNGGNSSPEIEDDTTGTGGTIAPPTEPIDPAQADKLTVVVAVIDSLMPEDIDPMVMPNVANLMDLGTTFTESRSVFSAETIPNHVAMMTGVYPDRNGIPTNNFWDKETLFGTPDGEDLDNPNELTAKTLFTWINDECRTGNAALNPDLNTAAIMSKNYLYHIFNADPDPDAAEGDGTGTPQPAGKGPGDEPLRETGNDIADIGGVAFSNITPDFHWDPKSSEQYIKQGSEHTPDTGTGPISVDAIADANFMFINLGDVDRSSHASGGSARLGTRGTADQQIGDLMTELVNTGRWNQTIFIVVSDHGMDFAPGFEPGVAPTVPDSGDPNAIFTDPTSTVVSGLSTTTSSITTTPLLDQLNSAECGFEPMFAVQNGGTNSIYVSTIPDESSTVSAAQQTAWENSILTARACLLDLTECNTALDTYAADATACKDQIDDVVRTNYDQIINAWVANPNLYSGNNLSGNLDTTVASTNNDGKMPVSIKSRHENLGDLVLVAADTFKFSESNALGNPIPGNHGHLETIHNTMIISGGMASILNADNDITAGSDDHLERHAEQSENIDVAATVAWLFGMLDIDANGADTGMGLIQPSDFPDQNVTLPDYGNGTSRSGFDGRVLTQAFNTTTAPSQCGLIPVTP